jgi:AhpD family alkylhydroperoxidase
MSGHYEGDMPDIMEDLKHGIRRMREASPESWRAWANFVDAALKPSSLDSKTKELIALGMSITTQCKYCVGVHVQKCLDAGTTDAEINDVCKVAMLMGGAPAMTYIAEVHKAVEFYRSKQEQVA